MVTKPIIARGLVRLPEITHGGTTLNSLAQGDTATLAEAYKTLTHAFLLKRYRLIMQIELVAPGVSLPQPIFYIAAPGINEAESEVVLEATPGDPDDVTTWATYISQSMLIWDSIYSPEPPQFDAGADANWNFDSGWMSVGGKKGIPYPEGHGPEMHCYNNGGDFQADNATNFTLILEGVYLRD